MAVYLIRVGDNGPVRIGKANNPHIRLKTLQTAHYETLRLLRVWEGGAEQETALHRRFGDMHLKGDWFSFSKTMMDDVGLTEINIESSAREDEVSISLWAMRAKDGMRPEVAKLFATIEKRLKELGLSRRKACLLSGVAEQTIHNIKRGCIPSASKLTALAGTLGFSPNELLITGAR